MRLISPEELKKKFPSTAQAFIKKSRQTIQNILHRKDPRLLMIVGPCSIHNIEEAVEYARHLKELSLAIEDTCFIVMRSYVEKSRTCGGWKGLIYDPHLDESNDLKYGIECARTLLLALAEMEMPAATEFVTPCLSPYIEDLISWGCIGARTSTSQVHRMLASSLSMPIGFKNSIDGNIDSAIYGVIEAQNSHNFAHISEKGFLEQIKSKGNPYTHVVLRGGIDQPNYDPSTIQETLMKLKQFELLPRLLIDCSHDNSKKRYLFQKTTFFTILEQILNGNKNILGMMLESNLKADSQSITDSSDELQRGISITDSCLDFSTTAELLTSVSSMVMSLTQS